MSTQVVPVANSDNPFFNALPDDAVMSVFEYLQGENGSLSVRGDDRAVISTAAVCRNWRDDVVLTTERQKASTRLHQRINLQNAHDELVDQRNYPQQMIQLFRRYYLPIFRLPVLDFGDRLGGTGYIDMLRNQDMAHPIMR